MASVNGQLPLHTPGLGFQVLHYWNNVSTPYAPPMVRRIGIFTSLEHAQDATRCEFQRVLDTYLRQGYYGRSFSEINLNLRGLITAYVDSFHDTGQVIRRELVLSEFQITTVDVWDPSWCAEVRRVGQKTLFGAPGGHPKSGLVVSMSKPSAHPLPPGPAPPAFRHEEELSPEWAASRVPFFTRRDEGPFRGSDDPPYTERMLFSPQRPSSVVPSAPKQSFESTNISDA